VQALKIEVLTVTSVSSDYEHQVNRKTQMRPHTSYLICATPRTGSYFLCEALRNTQLAGRPTEYFSQYNEPIWTQRWGVSSYSDYLVRVILAGTTPNGVFGGKIVWHQFEEFIPKLRQLPGLAQLPTSELPKSIFPNLRYIWLTRRDKLRQAISYSKALQTDVWSVKDKSPTPRKVPEFDMKAIERLLRKIEVGEEAWKGYFKECGVQPFEVVYEDLVHSHEQYEQIIRQILHYLDIPIPAGLTIPEPRYRKQADDTSEEWVMRYLQIKQAQRVQLHFETPPHTAEKAQASSDNYRSELKNILLNTGLKLGPGMQRNGKAISWVLDCREVLLTGQYLRYAGRLLWECLRPYAPDAVGGMTMSADPLTVALLYEAQAENYPLQGFVIRKEPKPYGLRKHVEGPPIRRGARVVLLDDLISSGTTIRRALRALQPFEVDVVAIGVIIDFQLRGSAWLREQQLPVESLFTLSELGVFQQQRPDPHVSAPLLWTRSTTYTDGGNQAISSPSTKDDAIFIVTDTGSLLALTLEGKERWRHSIYPGNGRGNSTPLIHQGRVYVGTNDGYVTCFGAEAGEVIWKVKCGRQIGSGLAVATSDGLILVGTTIGPGQGSLVALDKENGQFVWELTLPGQVQSVPCYDPQQRQVLVGTNDGELYAVDITRGIPHWKIRTGGPVKGKIAITEDGVCFAGSFDGYIYALEASSGRLRWKRRLGPHVLASPLVYRNLIVVGSSTGHIIAMEQQSGNICWIAATGGRIIGGAALVGEHNLAVGSGDGCIYLLEATSGIVEWCYSTVGAIRTTPTVGTTLFAVQSDDGKLYTFSY
jgi:LPS sulfotransferase NodH/outer membrane protein assembly factor BamB